MSRHARGARYGRYVEGPDPLAPPVDLGDALSAIGEEVMAGTSPQRAMREYLRRGSPDRVGLDELGRRVAQRRRELLHKHRLDGTLQEAKELLDKAVLAERKQLARDLDDDARFAEMRIENLPASTAAAVRELADYPWRSTEAREAYEQIKDLLGREVLEQRFTGIKQALEGATDSDREAVNEMLDDLNSLLEQHRRGEDTGASFADFMAKHGEFFPENPQTIDELIDTLARRAAAAARFRNSLNPEQRAELDALAQQAFGSPELMESLSRMDDNLRALRPDENWTRSEHFSGEQGLGLGDGTGALQDVADLDALADQLAQEHTGADLRDVDLEALTRQLGEGAAADVQALAELEQALRESGLLARAPDGSLRLSPKAMRRLGKTLLRDATDKITARAGNRDARRSGQAGEFSGASREWQFGDTEPWDVTRTVTNAVLREAAEGRPGAAGEDRPGSARAGRPGGPTERGVRLQLGDVEVSQTEARTRATVALLVDTSFSMIMEGRWVPMKRTALALHHLVSTRFRGDQLELVSFARHARTLPIDELVGLDGTWQQGTNLHHGLMLAARHFRRHPHTQPVLLVVTDGEPTAHLAADGEAIFDYPPSDLTLALTVRELDAISRLGARTTFFRLGDDPGLARFVDAMARRVDGHVVAPDLDDLGAAVVGSYLSGRWGRWGQDPGEQVWPA
ncbi:vWA domain-containing protein [Piscicoccus intestinalis]|uniref:vWA domain-containing protein n=1 Tax=Piscicoccus intestinalis TaxID=746033 RepID=UPI000837E6FE|nr:VWA domain-containing protein [Piscicoccus intestinalis]